MTKKKDYISDGEAMGVLKGLLPSSTMVKVSVVDGVRELRVTFAAVGIIQSPKNGRRWHRLDVLALANQVRSALRREILGK